MEVQVREKCAECAGAGVVQTAAWGAFWGDEGRATREHAEALRAHGYHGDANEHELAFFRERGWTVAAHEGCYGEVFPQEEEPCSECEGSTWTYRWVALEDLPFASELKRLRMGLASLDSMLMQEVDRLGG